LEEHPVGDINTGNLEGVVWYLQNEVVTMYGTPGTTRCPRKFNIAEIHRFKVRTRTSKELFAEGMNFGPRFAYDEGMCRGRCFAGNKCTCQPDCDYTYGKYGNVVGCNKFIDKYPYPDYDTAAPGGIWYALPLEGRCDYPTGAHDCTWSYEHAGHITLQELEAKASGGSDNCCNGQCTGFWDNLYDLGRTQWRVQQALDVFANKYTQMPRDLFWATCDFGWWRWYSPNDPWARTDPWWRDGNISAGLPDPLLAVDSLMKEKEVVK